MAARVARTANAMTDDAGTGAQPVRTMRPPFTRTYRLLARGTNVNCETLLATDYLNHYNEVVMLIEMVEQAPEFMDDVRAWHPKPYVEHFRDGGFSHKALAIAAYDQAPAVYREPFDATLAEIDATILKGIAAMDQATAEGDAFAFSLAATETAASARALIDRASAIINGHTLAVRQDEIDALMDEAANQQPREKYQTLAAPEVA